MPDGKRFFLTTAIDYPNSRPHIGTAFEKIGADVQARYRRMEGYDVFFLMGNDENTIKVARKARRAGPGRPRRTATTWPASSGGLGRPGHQLRRLHPDQRRTPPSRAAGSSSRRCTTTATSTRGPTRAGTATAARRSRPKRTWKAGLCPIHKTPVSPAQSSRATSSRCRSSRIGC